jgi:hypothetical protein
MSLTRIPVSALTGNDGQTAGGLAAEREQAAAKQAPRSAKLAALRDTLIVFSMQLSFRVTMFLRHLNY